jgi:RNA polymerase sigma-70 factor (ECF subfamily)
VLSKKTTMENTPQIFDKQVITHSKALYPFAYNLTKNVDDAQDLIQETMYRSLVNKEKFAEGTNLRAWLFTIMRNIFINNYRKNSKRQIVSDNTENQIIINNHSRTVGNIGETNLVMKEIENALSVISQDFSVPFMMHYKGFKYHEIAKELELPLGTVKSRIFFARKELQKRITRY